MGLNKLETVLLDGDGVLWHGEKPHPKLLDFFKVLNQNRIKWALLTNNNTQTPDRYVRKLINFGIPATDKQVFTSSTATITYLQSKYGNTASVHVVGMPDLVTTLNRAGLQTTTGEEMPKSQPRAVVAGMDRAITHDKIKVAMRLIMAGAEFVATNTDGSFPAADGINPGTGMVIGAIQATTAIQPTVMGKPEPAIFNTAIKALSANLKTTVMVGDRLETDILGAQRIGIQTVLVMTGVTDTKTLSESHIQPDYIFENIAELGNMIQKNNS